MFRILDPSGIQRCACGQPFATFSKNLCRECQATECWGERRRGGCISAGSIACLDADTLLPDEGRRRERVLRGRTASGIVKVGGSKFDPRGGSLLSQSGSHSPSSTGCAMGALS